MSYNIMKKRAGFAGSTEGTIENIVDTHTDQTVAGNKTFTNAITSSAQTALSASGKVSASFFYGDGSGLYNVAGGGGGSAAAQGPIGSLQFHTGSGGISGSAEITFLTASNTLEVLGDISASINISASAFYGDGENITNITAANISGELSASQIAHSSPLTNSAGNLTAKTNISRVIGYTAAGIGLDTTAIDASPRSAVNDTDKLITYNGTTFYSITFSAIESSLNIGGGQITGSNSINNAVLPSNISVTSITASTHVSASTFHGDGSGLTGVTGTPTPAGSNTQIQFNADGALGSSAGLTFSTGSNRLSVTGEVSASSNALFGGYVSASSYAIDGETIIDANANINCGEITASAVISSSANISGAAFYGDGRTLSGVPMQASILNGILRVSNTTNQTITSDSNFTYNGNDVTLTAGSIVVNTGNITASGHVSASTYYGDGSNLTGITASGGSAAAQGPIGSLQFHTGSGGISGSANILFSTSSNSLSISGDLTASHLIPNADEQYDIGQEGLGYENLYAKFLNGGISFTAENDEGAVINKGDVVYIKGVAGGIPTVALAACDDPSKMPAFGLVGDGSIVAGGTGRIITFGRLNGFDTSTFSEGDVLYVQTGSGGTSGSLTNSPPTGSGNLLQNIGKVTEADASGQVRVGGAGRTNATPNLDKGYIFIGNDTDQSVQDNTIFVSSSANRVGINNTNPDHTLTVTGDISASINISASAFYGDGSNLQNVSVNTFARTEVTSTPYTASISDYYIGVNTGSAATVQLPLASALDNGQTYVIKDESGNASVYNITLQASGSDVIDGQVTQTIESDYGAISLYSNGTDKYFIF